ncbi:hypothetical protein O181_039555 [Austropuccinia psidii MF-1]|uniref:Phosphotransferase n=1 Tax=Austropuccinia psidii MF-1 TaxID=1389203 RepID=A0A9Q3HFA2_9BASI|nr:hypothetical protein [Austropuccinia psidii MF-1]
MLIQTEQANFFAQTHRKTTTLDRNLINLLNNDQKKALLKLENLFELDKIKLNEIVNRFLIEFQLGLENSVENQAKNLQQNAKTQDTDYLIPMLPTFIHDVPHGNEKGTFLALDLGGTNLRICQVNLNGDKTFEIKSDKYLLTSQIKTGTAEALFDYIAECVQKFLIDLNQPNPLSNNQEKLCLGFTFSFPVLQTALDQGALLGWTKGFSASNAIGVDVVQLLQRALDKKSIPVVCNALVNDTVGTLMARAYQSGSALVGVIFGTGTNGAYVEDIARIKKLPKSLRDSSKKSPKMIINTEWGAFDNYRNILPFTKYDNQVDRRSINPRRQAFEKMVSGMYLGELTRAVLLDLIDEGLLFEGHSTEKFNQHYGFDTAVLSAIDGLGVEKRTEEIMRTRFGIERGETTDWVMIESVCELIGVRAARLAAAAIAAVIRQTQADKKTDSRISIGADGSVILKYEKFKGRMIEGLSDLFDEDVLKRIDVDEAHDGSGVGAALCALQAKKQQNMSD